MVLEPPATGAGGRSLSPSSTGHLFERHAEPFGRGLGDDGVGAGADLMRRRSAPGPGRRAAAARAPSPAPICVG